MGRRYILYSNDRDVTSELTERSVMGKTIGIGEALTDIHIAFL